LEKWLPKERNNVMMCVCVKKEGLTDYQNFWTENRKVWSETCVKVSSHNNENKVCRYLHVLNM